MKSISVKTGQYLIFIFAYWHDSRWNKFVGATIKIWDLAQNLANLGNDVILFLPKYDFNRNSIPFKIVEIPFIDLPLLRLVSFNIALVIYIVAEFLRRKPDVIYMRRMNSIVPALFAKLCRSKFLFEVNDDPFKKEFQEGLKSIFRFRAIISLIQDKINLRFCDRALVITKPLAEKIIKLFPGMNKRKMSIIPSGANIDLFQPLDKLKCRQQLGLSLSNKLIGFAGSLLKHQGIDTLIDAAPYILKEEADVAFIIIGEGPIKKGLVEKAKRLSLGAAFVFTGQVDYRQMPKWIGAMDICVAPLQKSAGLRSPAKLFDYLACARPVIASKIEGTTDVFEKIAAIRLIEAEQPEILAKEVLNLLRDKAKARQMGEVGRRLVVKDYDRKLIAKKIHDQVICHCLNDMN
jgi:glycosyltransferase involved in cell wall biosynthesis